MKRIKRNVGAGILAAVCLLLLALPVIFITGKSYSHVSLENTKELSEGIRSAMQNRFWRIRIHFQARTQDRDSLEKLVDGLMEEAFSESADPRGGDYLRFQYGGYEWTRSMRKGFFFYRYQLGIIPEYYTTAAQEEAVDVRVKELIQGKTGTDYEKIRWVCDTICRTCRYDTVHKHMAGSRHIQSTAYGVLIGHTALCQGYAVCCYRLLKELGLDARVITGDALVDGIWERHAWNIVRIGDLYYNLDVTLDDVSGSRNYLLKSDAAFARDHRRDEKYRTGDFMRQYPMSGEDYGNE